MYLMLQQEFRQVTDTVYNEEYEWALQEINKLISDDPYNSNLYSNRALLLSQLERDQDALKDLSVAILLNPRNYIAYFNMFSALYRLGQNKQAFEQLCCSLSCLHLMKARLSKSVEQTVKAIKYSHNNVQAHVLKGLIYSQQGKHIQAYAAFDEASSIDPSNELFFSLKAISFSKAFTGEKQSVDYYDAEHYKKIQKKLKCTFRIQQNLQEQHFQQKLDEFNALYTEINVQIGAVTQKVTKTQTTISVSSSKSKSKGKGKGKAKGNDEMVVIEDQGQPTPKQSQIRPEPGNIYIFSSKISKMSVKQSKQVQINKEEQDQFKSILYADSEQNESFQSILQSKIIEEPKQAAQKDQHFNQQALFVLGVTQNHITHQHSQMELSKSDRAQLQKQDQAFQFILSHHEQIQPINAAENILNQQYNLIYPLDSNYQLKLLVIKLKFTEMSLQYSDLYCIITYSRKITTLPKPTINNICEWNQEFTQIAIPNQPTDMKIKIFNKKYQSIRDEYIGQVEVLITTADLLKLPIYSKKGDNLGEILVNLQLVQLEQPKQKVYEQYQVSC